jgi:hypothetical protein
VAQGSYEGGRLPMCMWQRCPATLSLDGPAVASCHPLWGRGDPTAPLG